MRRLLFGIIGVLMAVVGVYTDLRWEIYFLHAGGWWMVGGTAWLGFSAALIVWGWRVRLPWLAVFLCLSILQPLSAATYYIDWTTGDDTNNGTAKETPWKRCPGMQGFAGTYVHAAGDQFIFKGGVTWPNAALSLYITNSGTAANRDYYGIDVTWYTGDQYVNWVDGNGVTRQSFNWPVLDAEGVDIVDARSFGGSSAAGEGTRNVIVPVTGDYITIEGLAMRGVRITNRGGTTAPSGNPDAGNMHTARCYTVVDVTFEDCYFSDWVVETALGGDVGGPLSDNSTDTRLINCRIHGPDDIAPQYITAVGGLYFGQGCRGFTLVQGCDISQVGQGIWNAATADGNIVHNVGWYTDSGAHPNAIWAQGHASRVVRNNTVRDCDAVIYLIPGYGGTPVGPRRLDAYNNVFIDVAQINLSPQNATATNVGSLYFVNNVVHGSIQVGTTKSGVPFDTLTIQNNLFVSNTLPDGNTGSVAILDANDLGNNYTNSNNVYWNVATATANGLTDTNLFEPTAEIAALFDLGADVSSITTTDHNGDPRNVGAATDIGPFELQTEVEPNPGVIQFEVSAYEVAEGTATVTLRVTRTGGSDGIVGATWNLNDGTATDTDDYTDDTDTVSFGDGVTTTQEFTATITNDSDIESGEAFTADLSSPTGSATLGALDTATITITDNDTAGGVPLMPSLAFEADAGLLENGGTATLLTTTDGWIYQTTQTTTPSNGYRARYRFIPEVTGDYIIRMSLLADTTSSDSTFVHVYATASPVAVATPDHIYDVLPLTDALDSRDVNNRGSGAFDDPEFAPVTYALTAETDYTLEVRGREANCFIAAIEIVRVVSGTPIHRPRGRGLLILP